MKIPGALMRTLGIDKEMQGQIEAFAGTASDPVQFVQNSIAGPLFQPHVQGLAAWMAATGASIRMELHSDGERRGFAFFAVLPDGTETALTPFNTEIPKP